MRTIALAAVMGAALIGVAAAETWTDPNGRLTFEKPSGWGVETAGNTANGTAVLTFNASNDCFLFGLVNPASANRTANDARNATAAMTPEQWTAAAGAGQLRRDFFPDGAAAPVSTSVDTSGFWPVQRAQFQGARTVFAAIETRPGFELRAFCAPTNGASSAAFEQILTSLGHPNDASWEAQGNQAAADRQAAADAAAAAAAAAAQQPQQQQSNSQAPVDENGVERSTRDPRARRRRDD